MSIIRLDRFTADHEADLIARRRALVAAVRRSTPGLRQARLTGPLPEATTEFTEVVDDR